MKYYVYFALLMIAVSGCVPTRQSSNTATEDSAPKRKGIVNVEGSRKIYDPTPAPSKYYGQLYISAKVYPYYDSSEGQSSIAKYVSSTFGSKIEQFGISVTPVLGGTKLPSVVLFSYRFDSDTQSWKVSAREKYVSPTILIDAGTKIEFEINYLYSTSTTVTLTKSAANLASSFAVLNPGAWIISSLSAAQVQDAAKKVDDSISKVMAQSADYSVSSYFQPAGDGSREAVYDIIPFNLPSGNSIPLANVTLSTVLSPSLVGKPIVDPKDAAPPADSAVNPLIQIKKDGTLQTSLWQVLKDDASFVYLRSSASQKGELTDAQVSQFEEYCSNVREKMQESYGLNYYDSINALTHILRSTQFTKNHALYNSNCLSGKDKQALTDMGIPLVEASNVAMDVRAKEE